MKKCEHCNKALTARKKRFCDDSCGQKWHYWNTPYREKQLNYSKRRTERTRAEQAPDRPTAHFSLMESRILRPLVERGLVQHEPIALMYESRDGKRKAYRPDAVIVKNGIALELKIELRERDRVKYIAVGRDNPGLDLRFVLARPNCRVGRGASALTQAQWCEKHGFKCAYNDVPEGWLHEISRALAVAVLAQATRVLHVEKPADSLPEGKRVRNVRMKRKFGGCMLRRPGIQQGKVPLLSDSESAQ